MCFLVVIGLHGNGYDRTLSGYPNGKNNTNTIPHVHREVYWYHSNYPKEWLVLSQIRGSIVVLRDRIHKEQRHTIDPNQFMIKLGKQSN